MINHELAEELYKQSIKKFGKLKLYSSFTGNIWSADRASMQLISKFNTGIRFLLWVADIIPLKTKKLIMITNAF